MPGGQLDSVSRLSRLLADEDKSDAQLLERFVRHHDEEAFRSLVRRHGPMVLGTCRRILRREEDAEDAFQGTFLVLARKAAAIRNHVAVGSWLHGVAARLALRLRSEAARRRAREQQLFEVAVQDPLPDLVWRDLRPVLDEVIAGLPRKYHDVFVLCQLEGKTNLQAAPLGTVLSRLSRARELLRRRLSRRGVTLWAGLFLAVLTDKLNPAVLSGAQVQQTISAAMVFAAGKEAVAGMVSAHAVLLADGVLHAMFITRIRIALGALVLLLGMVGTGVYSGQVPTARNQDAVKPGQTEDNYRERDPSGVTEKKYTDPAKESLRLANKLLQEEIEDEKAKLEALQKKLQRLKKSGLHSPEEDPVTAELKRENRKLQREMRRLHDEVLSAQEEVLPYMQMLQSKAGAKDAYNPYYETKKK
jgi:RNA polymerase sigma factor (sigma-70 family)